jgi:hypothetical protein
MTIEKTLLLKVSKLGKVETVTKSLLSELSRSILSYHLNGGHDVRIVNKLLSVLSPVNMRAARLYFRNFLPYRFNEETNQFGGLILKEAKKETHYLAIGSFLHDPENDIWSWSEEHIKIDEKPVNYAGKVTSAVKKALEQSVDKDSIIKAVLEGGVTVADLIKGLEAIAMLEETAVKKAA